MAEKSRSVKKSAPRKAAVAAPKARPAQARVRARKGAAKAAKKAGPAAGVSAKVAPAARAPRAIKGLDEMARKRAELEAAKKKVKAELRKEHARILRKAERIEEQYRNLFDEPLGSLAPRAGRGVGKASLRKGPAKRRAVEPIAKSEVAAFIEQKEQGIALESIKIGSRRIKTIRKIDEAYERAEKKDAASVFASL